MIDRRIYEIRGRGAHRLGGKGFGSRETEMGGSELEIRRNAALTLSGQIFHGGLKYRMLTNWCRGTAATFIANAAVNLSPFPLLITSSDSGESIVTQRFLNKYFQIPYEYLVHFGRSFIPATIITEYLSSGSAYGRGLVHFWSVT